jgi:hypothetical protein
MSGWANARQEQQLGRVDGATAQDEFAGGVSCFFLSLVEIVYASTTFAIEQQPGGVGVGFGL